METFENLNLGDFFTLERNLSKQRLNKFYHDKQTVWEKKSSRTAWQYYCGPNRRWFYFNKKEIVYEVNNE